MTQEHKQPQQPPPYEPPPSTGVPRLLTENSLVIQQTRSFLSNDFALEDERGMVLGRVHTTGSLAVNFLKGNRSFDLVDDRGQPLLTIRDPFDLGLDRYELYKPDGSFFAHVQKHFSFLTKRLSIELPQLTLNLEGNLLEYSFNIMAGSTVAAQVSRQWGGLTSAIRGKSRYGVHLDPVAPAEVRLAIIGALVALDLIRAKDSK
ncbi:LURP-one-related/scramblase family protein [Rothia sp. P5766]|uniref:LURP-one-related/scramblase family protein n=1 Tax=unclassified Rothia (in: high G+C Gram-positive bacteria) TaxID=2689056 RepID=UPI003ADDC21F